MALAIAAMSACGEHNPTDPGDIQDPPPASLDVGDTAPAAAEAVAAATRLPRSFFVDPRFGSDGNPGTKLKPFKTLAHGLALAITGDSMRLAAGVYSKETNGEKFTTGTEPVTVPAGVSILGTLAEDFTSRLRGGAGDSYGLDLKGGATVKNLVVSDFPVGIRAVQGTQTLKTVILDQNRLGLDLRGSAKATLTGNSKVFLNPSNLAGTIMGANLGQQAQLLMTGGMISGAGQNCRTDVKGIILNDASRLTINGGGAIENIAGNALLLRGTSNATVTGSAAIYRSFTQLGVGCTPLPSVVTQDSASLTFRKAGIASLAGTNSIGIQSSSRGLLTLDTAQVFGHSGAGIKALTDPRIVVKRGSIINGNNVGIDVSSLFSNLTVTGSVIAGNAIGIRAPLLKLRGSKVSSNGTGIVLTSVNFFSDLGTLSAPGNNTIKDNSVTGLRFDIGFEDGPFLASVFAAGNNWDPSTQGSDASGHYAHQEVFGPNSGKNFQLDNFKFYIDF